MVTRFGMEPFLQFLHQIAKFLHQIAIPYSQFFYQELGIYLLNLKLSLVFQFQLNHSYKIEIILIEYRQYRRGDEQLIIKLYITFINVIMSLKIKNGEMSEWPNVHAWKVCVPHRDREFESPSLRGKQPM